MWHDRRRGTAIWLLLLLMVLLGFAAGYSLLPQTAAARLLNNEGWLKASLPFAQALPPMEDTNPPAAEVVSDTNPELPPKADPRLIMLSEESVAAQAALKPVIDTSSPLIAIYCTHSSEEYRGEKRVPGARGGIHTVAKQLCDSLNALGLSSIYCDTVHDHPDWDLSYAHSLSSVQALQKQYPSLQVFIDVHRDSQSDSVLTTANGNVARIMLVVGSDARLAHPNWQHNRAFSEQIRDRLEETTPGLTRGVSVQKGRYNQHVAEKAILVEMGSTVNTTAEACASAVLLAEALAQVLQ